MTQSESDQQRPRIRDYLLNKLDEEEQQKIEESYFCSGEALSEFEMVEEELVEDYVRGLLSPEERELFVRHLLTLPRYAQKVQVARELGKYAQQNRPSEPSPPESYGPPAPPHRRTLSTAVLGLLLLSVCVLGLWALFKYSGSGSGRVEIAGTPTPRPASSPAGPGGDVLPPGPPFEVALLPVRVRSGKTPVNEFALPRGSHEVLLRLPLPNASVTELRAILLDDVGSEVADFGDLHAQKSGDNSSVVVRVPARLLPRGDYQINLLKPGSPGEEIVTFYFSVVKIQGER